jgi:hypothetical protein
MLVWEINWVTGRIFELREKGLVEFATERLCRITKRRVSAWKIKAQVPAKDPSMFRSQYCTKTAVTYREDKSVCSTHSQVKVEPTTVFS